MLASCVPGQQNACWASRPMAVCLLDHYIAVADFQATLGGAQYFVQHRLCVVKYQLLCNFLLGSCQQMLNARPWYKLPQSQSPLLVARSNVLFNIPPLKGHSHMAPPPNSTSWAQHCSYCYGTTLNVVLEKTIQPINQLIVD